MHSTGASAFFIVVYLHMFRGLLYGSYRKPRELVWIFGMLIYLCLMAEAFFGYLLPWGQMSYWGAQVIVNLFDAIPLDRPRPLAVDPRRLRGVGRDAEPLLRLPRDRDSAGAAGPGRRAHHGAARGRLEQSRRRRDQEDTRTRRPGIRSTAFRSIPYYTVKDTLGVVVFLIVFCVIMFFMPEFGGYFLEYNNFIPADPLKTPAHIAPVWYFTPYYSILRAMHRGVHVSSSRSASSALRGPAYCAPLAGGMPEVRRGRRAVVLVFFMKGPVLRASIAKVWGVVLMGLATLIFFLLPWLDQSPVKSIRYKGRSQDRAGAVRDRVPRPRLSRHAAGDRRGTTASAQVFTLLYFAFFLLMPWYTRMEKTKPEPDAGHACEDALMKTRQSSLAAVLALRRRRSRSASESEASSSTAPRSKPDDLVSLQRGAHAFVNYCLSCHSASYMRYNRLADLGLTEQQIRDNLILTGRQGRRSHEDGDGPEGRQGMVRRARRRICP